MLCYTVCAAWYIYRLFEALKGMKGVVDAVLEKLVVQHWLFAIKNQRFTFKTPDIVVHEIEKLCLD